MGSSLALTLFNATVKNNGEETWAPLKCGDFIVHSIYHVYKPLCGSDIGATDQRTLKLQEAIYILYILVYIFRNNFTSHSSHFSRILCCRGSCFINAK